MAEFHSIKISRLPSLGTPGDVYFCVDTGELFLCIGDGRPWLLKDLLNPKPGKEIVGPPGPPGPQGPPGDVRYVGPAELEAAVKKLRDMRARMHATIAQAIADSEHLPHAVKQLLKSHFEKLQQDLQAL